MVANFENTRVFFRLECVSSGYNPGLLPLSWFIRWSADPFIKTARVLSLQQYSGGGGCAPHRVDTRNAKPDLHKNELQTQRAHGRQK